MAYFELTAGANLSTAQAITTSTVSTNVFDVTGAGVGNLPTMIGANGVNTAMGFDIGAGDGPNIPVVLVAVTTAGTGTGTISIGVEAAPDSGTGTEGTYTVLTTTAAFVGSTLAAGKTIKIPVPPVPATFSGVPRFYKLVYTQTGNGAASFTANLMINAPDLATPQRYGSNFTEAH